MKDKIERDNLDVFNYRAIELLAQLNCLKPSEKLIYKAESLLRGICRDGEKTSYSRARLNYK
jgi:hypothetical protein